MLECLINFLKASPGDNHAMKHTVLILLLAASATAASAQAPAKPATMAPKHAATAVKPAAAATKSAAATSPTVAAIIKAPAGIPHVPGVQKPIFTVALRYQDIQVGTGALAEPNKLYKVLYTGWRAADGVKFDSSDDHRMPLKDKDGKPIMGDDGKPKLGDPQALPFPQGMGGVITGFDQGFAGMKVGGKRRIFIPWQLAYGTRNMPDHGADHPGIPPKSDLIFDVELVSVSDMPSMLNHPSIGTMPPMPTGHPAVTPGMHPMPVAPAKTASPGASTAPATVPATAPAAPAASAAPAQPQPQPKN
jgi:peptidylprolyl isomerase